MLPNLIVIGAQICGTTSLHYYLSLHPQVSMSKEKELLFFREEHNWPKGIAWYASHFHGKAKVHGESSPGYTNYPQFAGVPSRMYPVLPKAAPAFWVADRKYAVFSIFEDRASQDKRIAKATVDRTLGEDVSKLRAITGHGFGHWSL